MPLNLELQKGKKHKSREKKAKPKQSQSRSELKAGAKCSVKPILKIRSRKQLRKVIK